MKILLVDDDDSVRSTLRAIITKDTDHQITEAASGAEAWALLDNPSRYFDVAFLDVSMPDMDGLELLAKIRASPMLQSLRVIMCTGNTDRATVARVIQLGTKHYIVKPPDPAIVHAKLKQIESDAALANPTGRIKI